MVCRASWGERESGGGNDDENERTRLVEVRPTGSVCASPGRTVRPHRQPRKNIVPDNATKVWGREGS